MHRGGSAEQQPESFILSHSNCFGRIASICLRPKTASNTKNSATWYPKLNFEYFLLKPPAHSTTSRLQLYILEVLLPSKKSIFRHSTPNNAIRPEFLLHSLQFEVILWVRYRLCTNLYENFDFKYPHFFLCSLRIFIFQDLIL